MEWWTELAAETPETEGNTRMRAIASITAIVVGIIMAIAGVATLGGGLHNAG